MCQMYFFSVSSNVMCGICRNIFHCKCIGITNNTYRSLSNYDKDNCMCDNCINLFPFNNILDDQEFTNYSMNINCLTQLENDSLLFNPFSKDAQDTSNLIINGADPDSNYYAKSQEYFSSYYTINDFNKSIVSNLAPKNLSMIHNNIRSATKNGNTFSHYLRTIELEFDIIALSETWFSEGNHDLIGFPNYNHVSTYRPVRTGGGVSLLIKDNLYYKELQHFKYNTDILESVFVEIEMIGKNIVIGCIYRPPNSNLSLFNDSIGDILDNLNKQNKIVYLLGDFNIDLLKYEKHLLTTEYINSIFSLSFMPLIHRPTRVTNNTASIIDNILSNWHNIDFISGILPCDISDHFPIFNIISLKSSPVNFTSQYKYIREINELTISNCSSMLSNIDWSNTLDCFDADTSYNSFITRFNGVLNISMPLKRIKLNRKHSAKPWITKSMLTLIKQKNEMYTQLKIMADNNIN